MDLYSSTVILAILFAFSFLVIPNIYYLTVTDQWFDIFKKMSTVALPRLPSRVAEMSKETTFYTWSWSSFSLNVLIALHLPGLNFICHYMGWLLYIIRSSLSSSPSALIFMTNNSALSLKLLTFLLTSSCSSLLWVSSAADLSALSLLSPLWGLTISFQFVHLDPSSFTAVLYNLHSPENPYSLFSDTTLEQMVVIMANQVVSNLWCLEGGCHCCKACCERHWRAQGYDGMLLPGNWSNI